MVLGSSAEAPPYHFHRNAVQFDPMRIDLNCAKCGGNRFTLDDQVDDSSQIECLDCGHKIGSMAELKEKVAKTVLSHSRPRAA